MGATTAASPSELRPHPGPQWDFLGTSADIAIMGGGAGGGKSHALLMEPLRHVHNKHFGAVVFRRELTRIRNQGGMWDEALRMYLPLDQGVTSRESPRPEIKFPSGASIQFGHLEHE